MPRIFSRACATCALLGKESSELNDLPNTSGAMNAKEAVAYGLVHKVVDKLADANR